MPKVTKADLESENARLHFELGALQEWFYCVSKGHATHELEATAHDLGDGVTFRVVMHGMHRASGGVAIVAESNCDAHTAS